MISENCRIGFALCGSYCTFSNVFPVIEKLKIAGYDIFPIISENVSKTDSRFGTSAYFKEKLESITGHEIIDTIEKAEPIGPKKTIDVLIIAPCTGNTIAKLANGIADTSVTLAAKAHLRNDRPVVVAVSSNDALAANAKNIGILLNQKNYYFVPMRQDDPEKKPRSVVADMNYILPTIEQALEKKQMQPIFL